MTHHDLMAQREKPDPRDPNPACTGECEPVSGGFWDDVRWVVTLSHNFVVT
jgi:hypothetical protein